MHDQGAPADDPDTMTIAGPGWRALAVIKKALITPLRDRWSVNVKNGLTWTPGQHLRL